MKLVVIGGVAAGMSAASQMKRRQPDSQVVVLERGPHVSYGACGMPYNIEDPSRSMDDLVVVTAERFRKERGIDVRTGHEVLGLDVAGKTVSVREIASDRTYEEPYDRLVIATGARAVRPPLPGLDLPGVFLLRELTDGEAIKAHLTRDVRRAVIVGAGYIGMEMAEVLTRRGLEVTVLEREPQVLPGFDAVVAGRVESTLEEHGVTVHTGVSVEGVSEAEGGLLVHTSAGSHRAGLVVVSVGVRPNAELALEAGIALGATGAIVVDRGMRTSEPDVFAAGDCAEDWHRVLEAPAWIPLGTTANKQGKVAGANAAGEDRAFPGIVGTAGFRVLDLEVARTGLSAEEARRAGLAFVRSESTHSSRGHSFPGSGSITTVLLVAADSGRLLGAQMVGPEGVALRIDVLAAALTAGMKVAEIENLDLAYAPPFAPVYDPILIAASVAKKALAKDEKRRP